MLQDWKMTKVQGWKMQDWKLMDKSAYTVSASVEPVSFSYLKIRSVKVANATGKPLTLLRHYFYRLNVL